MTDQMTHKFYISKYALSTGIKEVEGFIHATIGDGDMLVCPCQKPRCGNEIYHGNGLDWHETREGAVAKAEQMRTKKIAALRKQIERLEKMRFDK